MCLEPTGFSVVSDDLLSLLFCLPFCVHFVFFVRYSDALGYSEVCMVHSVSG